MPSQSSQSSSDRPDKNKNLIAAKATLGLTSIGRTSSSQRKLKSSSIGSSSSSDPESDYSNESPRKFPATAQEDAHRFSSNIRNNRRSKQDSPASSDGIDRTQIHSKGSDVHDTSPTKANVSFQTFESVPELSTSFENHYSNNIDHSENVGAKSLQSIIEEESNSVQHDSNTNASKKDDDKVVYDSNNNLSQNSDTHYSNTNVQQENNPSHNLYASPNTEDGHYYSTASNLEEDEFYDSNKDEIDTNEFYESSANNSTNTHHFHNSESYDRYSCMTERSVDDLSQQSREDFVPQRFDEMRRLLTSITPLQLQALVQQIFGNDGPPGWKFINNSSKMGYRKDAYLSELSLEELLNFARLMDNLGLDYCSSSGEALDLIAIEFERLVTLHQKKDDVSSQVNTIQQYDSPKRKAKVSFEEDHFEENHFEENHFDENHYEEDEDEDDYEDIHFEQDHFDDEAEITSDGRATGEGDNLRRSLRACSFSELRLVAERLHLDHSGCVRKEDLIYMIEYSMPHFVGSTDEFPQPEPFVEDFRDYSRPSHLRPEQRKDSRRNGEERKRRVKFAYDTKAGHSQSLPRSRDNAGDRQDLESAPLVSISGDKRSSRFTMLRKHGSKIAALVLIITLIGALSVGLSTREGKDDDDTMNGRPYVLLPENDPFFSEFYTSSYTSVPSSSPSQIPTDIELETTILNEERPASTSGGKFLLNPSPTTKPTTIPDEEPPLSTSDSVMLLNLTPTTKPTLFPTAETYMPTEADTTMFPTLIPTLVPTLKIDTEKPSSLPEISITITTDQPTHLSPFPLLGPFEETGMRMMVYGISNLSQMGSTQMKMLLQAYVEQFYNEEGRGADAIQNIVFDVAASIDIVNIEPHPARRRRRGERRLQIDSVIITFTMNLSFRSFSNSIDAKTVSERPFLEESMHAAFVQFLSDNNAARFVGNITGVSSIFRGDDVPVY